ncbi:hypothetical protein D3C72_2045110 [compost metagenome]
MQRIGHGMLHDHGAFGQALGTGGLDILAVEHIEQVGPHDAHVVRKTTKRRDEDDRPDMGHQVDELVPAPGRAAIAGGEEHADFRDIEPEDQEIEDDDREEEARDRHAEEGDDAQGCIDPGILPGGGENAEANA